MTNDIPCGCDEKTGKVCMMHFDLDAEILRRALQKKEEEVED